MKITICPNKHGCWGYKDNDCDDCPIGKLIEKQKAKIKHLTSERDEWKRRAEVAERALRNITERASCNICDNFSCRYYEGINFDYNAEDCIKWWLAQAEKELAEEKSNGEKKKV